MMKNYFYTFILYTDLGQKVEGVVDTVFPGLIKEPQRVRLPLQRPHERQRRTPY